MKGKLHKVRTWSIPNIPNSHQIVQLYVLDNFHHSVLLYLVQSSVSNNVEVDHHPKIQAGFYNSSFLLMSLNLQANAIANPCLQFTNPNSSLSLFYFLVTKSALRGVSKKPATQGLFCLFVFPAELVHRVNHHSSSTSWLILTILIFLHNFFSSSNIYLPSFTCILIADVRQATSRKFHLRTIILNTMRLTSTVAETRGKLFHVDF